MNKTIFITGAAKRIGKEIALTFKELGWNIIIHYKSSKKDADDLADQINKDNPNSAKTVQGNLDIKEDVQKTGDIPQGALPTDVLEKIEALEMSASLLAKEPQEMSETQPQSLLQRGTE